MDPAGTMDEALDALETYLATATLLRSWVGIEGQGGGHPNKRRFELLGGVYVVAKLGDDDNTARMARAEAAAWTLARLLGWHDLLAATVVRELEDLGPIPASVQVIWPRPFEWLAPLDRFDPSVVVRAAVFDVLVRMNDRANNNWLGVGPPGEEQALRLIDHGHAFTGQGSASSSFVDHVKIGAILTDDVIVALQSLTADRLQEELEPLVGAGVVQDLASRAGALARKQALIHPEQGGV